MVTNTVSLTEAGNKDNFSDGGAHTGGAWHSLRMALMPPVFIIGVLACWWRCSQSPLSS